MIPSRTRRHPLLHAFTAWAVFSAAVLGFFAFGAQPALAVACSTAGVTVTSVSSPELWRSNQAASNGLNSQYIGYRITNTTGGSLSSVWVQITGVTGGTATFAPNETGRVALGNIANGGSEMAYFYMTSSATSSSATNWTVRVMEGNPALPSSTEVCTQSGGVSSVEGALQANPNQVLSVVAGPTPPELGGIVTITTTGSTGTIGGAGRFIPTPAAFSSWPANAYQLIDTQVTLSADGTFTNNLNLSGLSPSSQSYTAVYTFRAIGVTTAPSLISPIAYINSGNPLKHTSNTSIFSDGTIPPLLPANNHVTLTKSATPLNIPGTGGVSSYTITVTNSGAQQVTLDDITDTIPPGTTVVPGTSAWNSAVIADPVSLGGDRVWEGPLTVPAGSSRSLTYDLALPGIGGAYVNSAVGHIGTVQIDETADTGDNSPASVTVTVGALPSPSLVVVKSAPVNGDEDGSGDVSVGDTLTYTVTATNNGTANLTGVVVSDPMLTPDEVTCALVLPGASCTLVGAYVVTSADVVAGSIVNEATADSVQTDGVFDSVTTTVPSPSLVVVKSAPVNGDEDGSGDVSVGDTLTYTVTATNFGTSTLTNLVITDDLIVTTGGTSPCAIVLPGGTCALIGTYVVTSTDVAAGQVVNTATAVADQAGPVSDTQTTPIAQPGLAIVKSVPVNADDDGSGDISVGDTLTYTITATNIGGANLTDVVVSDDRITVTGGTTPCAVVAPGDTCTLVGTYVVTAADANAGSIVNVATAESTQTAPVSDTVTVPVPLAALVVIKPAPVLTGDADGSGDISVGDTLTYTITATNVGAANLTDVVVTDDLIGSTGGTTPCAVVAPGGTCTLIGTYVVTPADVSAGSIVNTATASSAQTPPVNDQRTTNLPSPAMVVVKPEPVNADEDGSGDVSAGDTLTYTITATNTGSARLTNVVVTDDLITPSGGTTPCALLAPGQTCTLVGIYVVTPADVSAGTVINEATAGSDQTDTVRETRTTPVPFPGLSIDKSEPVNADEDGSGDVSVGDTLTYTITATNVGTATLTDVGIADDLITRTGGTAPCALLAPGDFCTFVGTHVVTPTNVAAGRIDNTATATSGQTPTVDDDVTVVVPMPALDIVKSLPTNADEDGSGDVSVGDTLTYTITATNSGGANLTNVIINDDFITPTGGSAPCAILLPGESCTLVGTHVVTPQDVASGRVVNIATALSDQTAPVTDTVSVPAPIPAIVIVKPAPTLTTDADGSGDVSVGDTLTYTVTATNVGSANLTDVVVTDDRVTQTGGTSPCALVVTGGTCTLVGTYVVTAADVATGAVVNEASVDSVQTGEVSTSRTTAVPSPSLVVVKPAPVNADEDGSGDVSAGDTLTYTITATNNGTANLTNVVVSDPLITPTGGSTPCALLSPGQSCTLVGTYVVNPADVPVGSVDNTATATSDQTDTATDTRTTPVPPPAMTITKSAPVNADEDGSGDVSVGDTLTYTVFITNTGAANLTNVVIVDDLVTRTGGNSPCALVVPGGTCTLIGTYVVTPGDGTAGEIVNAAGATSDQTPPAEATRVVPVNRPSIAIAKPAPVNADEDGSGDVSAGDTLTYTITATNDGTANLTNVTITDPLVQRTGGTAPCALVVPGGTCTLVGTYVVTPADVEAGTITNEATAGADQTTVVSDSVTVDVPRPAMTISKPAPVNSDEDRSGSITAGDTLTYTITVRNTGSVQLTNVTIADPMITATGGNAPCAVVAPGDTCTLIGTKSVTSADVTAGSIVNSATADSDQTDRVTDTVTVSTAATGQISGVLWTDTDGNGRRDPGEPPLAGVTVVLQLAGLDGVFGTADDVFRRVVTDGSGGYVFDGVPFGQLARVAVDIDTLPPLIRRPTYDLDGVLDSATIITLTPENPTATRVDFGYTATTTLPDSGFEVGPILRMALVFLVSGLMLLAVQRRRTDS